MSAVVSTNAASTVLNLTTVVNSVDKIVVPDWFKSIIFLIICNYAVVFIIKCFILFLKNFKLKKDQ